jgi:hypothetical protein
MSEQHSREPWQASATSVLDYNLSTVAHVYGPVGSTPGANAARIVACVNFCCGTDTEYLDGAGNLGRMLTTAGAGVNAELLAAAVEVATWLEQRTEHYQSLGSGSVAAGLYAQANILRAAILRARGETPPA